MDESRVFVVTGAASGIGRHLSLALMDRGHKVLAADVNEGGLADAARAAENRPRGKWTSSKLDVTSPEGWESVLDTAEKTLGPIDVLLNVAGVLTPGYIHETDERSVNFHIDVNVKGVIWGTRAAARRMVSRGAGHIVNFGSLASLAAVPGLCLYSASKFAVRGFSLACAAELRPYGVFVSLLMPDAVKTPMLDLQVHYPQAAMTFSGDAPLTVEDVEKVIVDKVLVDKPMEVTIPLARGLLARLANTAPEAALRLAPSLTERGKKKQEAIRQRGGT